MELLLLLTALFASLTGASSGERAGGVRPVQGVEVVARAAQAAVQPSRVVTAQARARAIALPRLLFAPRLAAAPIAPLRLAFEQRRE